MTNHLDLPSNNFEEHISPKILNNDKKKIRLANTTSSKNKNSKLADID